MSPAFLEAFCCKVSNCNELKSSVSTYIHSIAARRLLTAMAFSKSPEKRVGERVFSQIGKNLSFDFESRKVG
jgi:hypothetical protein